MKTIICHEGRTIINVAFISAIRLGSTDNDDPSIETIEVAVMGIPYPFSIACSRKDILDAIHTLQTTDVLSITI